MNRITVGNRLISEGIKPNLNGFHQIVDAVMYYKPGIPMMQIYQKVSELYGTKPSKVERNIRHAKEKTQNYKDLCNSEMVAMIRWQLESDELNVKSKEV